MCLWLLTHSSYLTSRGHLLRSQGNRVCAPWLQMCRWKVRKGPLVLFNFAAFRSVLFVLSCAWTFQTPMRNEGMTLTDESMCAEQSFNAVSSAFLISCRFHMIEWYLFVDLIMLGWSKESAYCVALFGSGRRLPDGFWCYFVTGSDWKQPASAWPQARGSRLVNLSTSSNWTQ